MLHRNIIRVKIIWDNVMINLFAHVSLERRMSSVSQSIMVSHSEIRKLMPNTPSGVKHGIR